MTVGVGERAPDFTLVNQFEERLSLSEHLSEPVVLLFYCLDWNPACEADLKAINAVAHKFRESRAKLLGISVDSQLSHRRFYEHLGLEFDLLSDFHRDVSRSYGVLDAEQGIAERATFVVDQLGIVRYAARMDARLPRDPAFLLGVIKTTQQLEH